MAADDQKYAKDDHDIRVGCAREFEHIRGEIERIRNGHESQAKTLTRLTSVLEKSEHLSRADHGEAMRAITGYQGTITAMMATQSERTALVEASSSSAHHRLDGQHKMLWGIVILLLTLAVGTVLQILIAGG